MTPRALLGVAAVVGAAALALALIPLAAAASSATGSGAPAPGGAGGVGGGGPVGPTWADRFQAWWNGTTAMLSPHFSEREALTSSRAWGAEHIIVPTPEQLANARLLAVTVLEPIRARWGRPVKVNSWIRDAFTNQLIGGAEHSDHMNGLAADIEIPGVPSAEVYAVVKAEFLPGFPIDQLIYYSQRGHVHVSTRANPRREAWIDDDP